MEQGSIIEAIQHARAARDFDKVADLVKRAAPSFLSTGQVSNLKGWLKAIPEGGLSGTPIVDLLSVLDRHPARECGSLQTSYSKEKENCFNAAFNFINYRLRGELMAVDAGRWPYQGALPRGFAWPGGSCLIFPGPSISWPASCVSDRYRPGGPEEEAGPAYRQAITQALAAGDYRRAADTRWRKDWFKATTGNCTKQPGPSKKSSTWATERRLIRWSGLARCREKTQC